MSCGAVGLGKAVVVRTGALGQGKARQGGYGETWSGGVCWVGVRRGMAGRLRCGVVGCGLMWHGGAVK